MYKKTDQLMPGHCGSRTVGGNEPSPSTLPTSDTMIKEIVLALAVFSCTTCKFHTLDMNVLICFYIFPGLFLPFFFNLLDISKSVKFRMSII